MRKLMLSLAVVVFTAIGEDGNAGVIAECGFNDAAGINADGVPSSPYEASATTLGRGTPETGWTDTWTGWTGSSNFVAESEQVFEGDLALRMWNTSSGLGYSTMREYVDQTGVFYVDLHVSATDFHGNSFGIYTGPETFNAHNVATFIALWDDASIRVMDGGTLWEDTGFQWSPSEWVRITQEVNVPSQTYRVWVNGSEYVAPDPLDFRHPSATSVDDIRFLLTSAHAPGSPEDVYVDAVRVLDHNPIPEPSTVLMLTAGAACAAAYACRKSRPKLFGRRRCR